MNSRLLHAIHQHADREPHAPALCDGIITVSYGEMVQRVESLAKALRASSARCVAIEMDNGLEWVLTDLACLLAEIPVLPLPPFFTAQQREHALRNVGANFVITKGVRLQPLAYEAVALPIGTAKITFTSGSTGSPKGICLSAHEMEQVALSLHEVLGDDIARHTAALLPLGVLLENVAGCYTTLLAGGCYDVRPQTEIGLGGKADFAALLGYLSESKATACILVPELLRGMLTAMTVSPVTLTDMRFMAVGGAKVSVRLLEQARTQGLAVYEGYGLSELASVVAVNTPSAHKAGSVGRALSHLKARCAADGEVVVTAKTAHQQAQEYATGDLGFMDEEGFLHITGRKKNLLITAQGRNVSPEWPEAALLAQPEILQTMVIGDAMPHLAALVVSQSSDAEIEQAIAQTNQNLPDYAQVRLWRRVPAFSSANGLLTGNGRLRREAIMETHHLLIQSIYEEHHEPALL